MHYRSSTLLQKMKGTIYIWGEKAVGAHSGAGAHDSVDVEESGLRP